MTSQYSQVPNPLPDPRIGDQGYEMWCLAAEYRPKWLASLTDPHSHFTQVQNQYNQLVDEFEESRTTESMTDEQMWDLRELAQASARHQIVSALPPREVTEPAWDHLDPMEDPALDQPVPPLGAPEDWTPPEPTLSELMQEEINKNS